MKTETLSPLSLSLSGHILLAAAFALLLWERPTYQKVVSFEVIDAPAVAPAPLRALQIEKPIAKPKARPQEVFGLSRKSITADPSQAENAVEVKAGNTVAKAQDNKDLKPGDPDSIPIPTEEYLVSSMPELISDFRVAYPPQAKKKGIQGAVIFDLLIDATGTVREAIFLEGPGEGLNEAATEAVRQLRFKPARVENQAVAVRIRYSYRFILER